MKLLFIFLHGHYPVLNRTVHPTDFGNKRFSRNACLLSRLFQTDKVRTKAETIKRNMRWRGLSIKSLFSELPGGVHSSFERSVIRV